MHMYINISISNIDKANIDNIVFVQLQTLIPAKSSLFPQTRNLIL